MIDQDAHQLGDRDARMGVVELDRRAHRQEMQVAVGAQMPLHQVLQRGGDEEIFLPQPQFAAGRRVVARDRGSFEIASARACSDSAPTWSPLLKASSRSGSTARADHSRSGFTWRPRQPTIGVS